MSAGAAAGRMLWKAKVRCVVQLEEQMRAAEDEEFQRLLRAARVDKWEEWVERKVFESRVGKLDVETGVGGGMQVVVSLHKDRVALCRILSALVREKL